MGHKPSHFDSVPNSTLQATQNPPSRKQPQLQRVQVNLVPVTATSAQLDGQVRQYPPESIVLAAHEVHVSLLVHFRQFCWQRQHNQSLPKKYPSLQMLHRVADPDLDCRQLATLATRQDPPEKQQPLMHALHTLDTQTAQLTVLHAVQVGAVKQQPLSHWVQVHTLLTTLLAVDRQPVQAQGRQAPRVRVQSGQHDEQLPQISAIFLQLLVLAIHEIPTRQYLLVSTAWQSFLHWIGVFWSLQRAAPGIQVSHSLHTPLVASRKQRSLHAEHLMKLLLSQQVRQPAEPLQVVSVQDMQRLVTRMPLLHLVQVDPSTHTWQLVGHCRQWSWQKQQLSRQDVQTVSLAQVEQPVGHAVHSPQLVTFQQQPSAQVRQLSKSTQVLQLASHEQHRLFFSQKPLLHTRQYPFSSTQKQPQLSMHLPLNRNEQQFATLVQSVHDKMVPEVREQHPLQVPQSPEDCGHWMHVLRKKVQPSMHDEHVPSELHLQCGVHFQQCCVSKKQSSGQQRRSVAQDPRTNSTATMHMAVMVMDVHLGLYRFSPIKQLIITQPCRCKGKNTYTYYHIILVLHLRGPENYSSSNCKMTQLFIPRRCSDSSAPGSTAATSARSRRASSGSVAASTAAG